MGLGARWVTAGQVATANRRRFSYIIKESDDAGELRRFEDSSASVMTPCLSAREHGGKINDDGTSQAVIKKLFDAEWESWLISAEPCFLGIRRIMDVCVLCCSLLDTRTSLCFFFLTVSRPSLSTDLLPPSVSLVLNESRKGQVELFSSGRFSST